MKNIKLKYIVLSGISLLILGFMITKINYQSQVFDITIEDKFYEGYIAETVMPEDYKNKCDYENKNQITFPRTKPDKVFLHSNDLTKNKTELSKVQIEELLLILNDSTNYGWGELGTPEIHYYFTYLNSKGEFIGITEVDMEGMAYSKPYIAKMKWGRLKNIEKLNKLITDIKKVL